MVNAEYVKYSLSLVEKDLYDKLGIKIETEVIPARRLRGQDPAGVQQRQEPLGPHHVRAQQHARLRAPLRAARPLDPEAEARLLHRRHPRRLQEALAAPRRQARQHALRRRRPHDVLEQGRPSSAPDNKKKFKAKYGYDLAPPKTWKQWDDQAEFFHGWGWDGSDNKLFGAGASYKPSRQRLLLPLVAGAVLLVRRPVLRRRHEAAHQHGGRPAGARGDGADHAVLSARRAPLRVGGAQDHADQGRGPAALLVDQHRQASRRRRTSRVIVGKAGFGLVPGAEIDGKMVQRPAITPGRAMAVSEYSKKNEATMKVLEFISLPDQSLKIVMDPKTIMDPWRDHPLPLREVQKAFPGADEYLDAIEKTFPLVVPDPVIPGADEYQRKLSFEITEALAKRKPPKDALDSAAARVGQDHRPPRPRQAEGGVGREDDRDEGDRASSTTRTGRPRPSSRVSVRSVGPVLSLATGAGPGPRPRPARGCRPACSRPTAERRRGRERASA